LAVGAVHLPPRFLRRQRQLLPLGLDQLAEIFVIRQQLTRLRRRTDANAAARTMRCPRVSYCAAIQRWRSVGSLGEGAVLAAMPIDT